MSTAQARSRSSLQWMSFALLLVGCGEAVDDAASERRGFDAPPPVVLPDRSGELLRLDPAALTVKRSVTLVFSTTDRPGEPNLFSGVVAQERRDALFAIDYASGASRRLVELSAEGRLQFSLAPLIEDGALYSLTYPDGGTSTEISVVNLSGRGIAQSTHVDALVECSTIAGTDFYFRAVDGLAVSRDFLTGGENAQFDVLAADTGCGQGLFTLDGLPVRLELEADVYRLQAIDPNTGLIQMSPLASIPVGDLPNQQRPIRFAVTENGLYAVKSDFVGIELWRSSYVWRPGELAPAVSSPSAARVARIDVSFFSELVPTGGAILVDSVFAFALRSGVLALGVRIQEDASDGSFFWTAFLVADLERETVDLFSIERAFETLEILGG